MGGRTKTVTLSLTLWDSPCNTIKKLFKKSFILHAINTPFRSLNFFFLTNERGHSSCHRHISDTSYRISLLYVECPIQNITYSFSSPDKNKRTGHLQNSSAGFVVGH